jgi:hypothetical protein
MRVRVRVRVSGAMPLSAQRLSNAQAVLVDLCFDSQALCYPPSLVAVLVSRGPENRIALPVVAPPPRRTPLSKRILGLPCLNVRSSVCHVSGTSVCHVSRCSQDQFHVLGVPERPSSVATFRRRCLLFASLLPHSNATALVACWRRFRCHSPVDLADFAFCPRSAFSFFSFSSSVI